jgi:hypothetical protein
MSSTKIYSIEFNSNYFIEPFNIQSIYESLLTQYNNKIRTKAIATHNDNLIYYTTLLDIPEKNLRKYKVQNGLYINFY